MVQLLVLSIFDASTSSMAPLVLLLLHYEEGAQRGPVRGEWNLLLAVFAVSRFRNAHAEIRQRPPDEWLLRC